MVKIVAALLVFVALIGGGLYYILQPQSLPIPVLEQNPSGVAQSTLNDVRIVDPSWLSTDGNRLWVVCRFGQSNRARTHFLLDLDKETTLASLKGATLVSWINEREILVYNQGGTDSRWDDFLKIVNPETPSYIVTQFFRVDVATGKVTRICQVRSTRGPSFVDLSPNSQRVVLTFGPKEAYEFEVSTNAVLIEVVEEYVWAPKWIDNDTYLFVGETSVLSRTFGADDSRSVSQALLGEVREAIADYGSPTIRVCGQVGGDTLMVDHNPELDYDRLLVLDRQTTLVEPVTHMIASPELPRFNPEGTMMVYEGQQFDKNMDSVYLQTVEMDSQPIELIAGEFGGTQESTPLFRNTGSVVYVHRGIEVRSISLADGNIQLHWPIAVVP